MKPSMKLKDSFYIRNTKTVTQELLGKKLLRIFEGRRVSGLITEVEAYLGRKHRTWHSFASKKTNRNQSNCMSPSRFWFFLTLIFGNFTSLPAYSEINIVDKAKSCGNFLSRLAAPYPLIPNSMRIVRDLQYEYRTEFRVRLNALGVGVVLEESKRFPGLTLLLYPQSNGIEVKVKYLKEKWPMMTANFFLAAKVGNFADFLLNSPMETTRFNSEIVSLANFIVTEAHRTALYYALDEKKIEIQEHLESKSLDLKLTDLFTQQMDAFVDVPKQSSLKQLPSELIPSVLPLLMFIEVSKSMYTNRSNTTSQLSALGFDLSLSRENKIVKEIALKLEEESTFAKSDPYRFSLIVIDPNDMRQVAENSLPFGFISRALKANEIFVFLVPSDWNVGIRSKVLLFKLPLTQESNHFSRPIQEMLDLKSFSILETALKLMEALSSSSTIQDGIVTQISHQIPLLPKGEAHIDLRFNQRSSPSTSLHFEF